MSKLLSQLKKRRKTLGLKQDDMLLRIGMSRQQYQQLESSGNPRLNTLELVAKGLNSELMLIPSDKLNEITKILSSEDTADKQKGESSLIEDPWKDVWEEGDD